MREAAIYRNGIFAGVLKESGRNKFSFSYDDKYFSDTEMPGISLTLPKTNKVYYSEYLFPFFFNMLPEGVNKELQCRRFKIDENDFFGLLLASAQTDTEGAVTVKPLKEDK